MKVFFKKGVRPQLLPKRGRTSIKKERRNMRADCRARENRRRGARAAGERRGPRHHRVYADVKGVNNANVFEKEEKKIALFLSGNKTIMERSVQKVNSLL